MHTLKIDSHVFAVPENWNELTTDQFLTVASLSEKKMSLARFQLTLFTAFTKLRVLQKKEIYLNHQYYYYLAHGITREFLVSLEQLALICRWFDFMLQPSDEQNTAFTVNYTGIRNLVPVIPASYGMLHGPADGLSNLLFSEYIYAETAFDAFKRTGRWKYALRLAAILYRPEKNNLNQDSPDYNGDPRESFNDFLVTERCKKLESLDTKYISAVLMWYSACREWIRKTWPEPFEADSASTSVDAFTGFMKMVTTLANNDVTRSDQVRQSYLYDIMFTLQALAVENKRIRESLKNKNA